MSVKDGGQAFPRSYAYQNPEAGRSELKAVPGMTVRQYFAGEAMKGLLSQTSEDWPNPEIIAAQAVKNADALIAELEEEFAGG
jgi:hypothetical protein